MTDLHDLLRDLTDRPPTPDPITRVGRVVARDRRRRRTTAACLGAAVLVSGAAAAPGLLRTGGTAPGGTAPGGTAAGDSTPGYTAPVVPLSPAERLAPARTPCRTEDLRTSATRMPTSDMTVRLRLEVRNAGLAACEITNESLSQVVDEHGSRLSTGGVSSDLVRRPPQPALQPGETSTTYAVWTRWCGQDAGRWQVRVLRMGMTPLVFTPPAGLAPPACHPGPVTPLVFSTGRWRTLNQYGQPTDNPAEVLTVELRLLSPAVRARPLRYRATLTNTTADPVVLPTCPQISAVVFRNSATGAETVDIGSHTPLPCASFGSSLASFASVTVEGSIRLDGVVQGEHLLSWSLETSTGKPAAELPLTVVDREPAG